MTALRIILLGASLFLFSTLGARAVDDDTYQNWRADWERWQEIAARNNWDVTPLQLRQPASASEIDTLGKAAGVPVPSQLRSLLKERAAGIAFGWYQPGHLQSMHRLSMPFGSASRDILWDIDHIRDVAIPVFDGWRDALAQEGDGEARNTAQMWEGQFPLSELMNGDVITIDVSDPDRQPIRYFSHELEGWHGTEIAPDLYTYITVRSALGWAGTEQDSMFRFTDKPDTAGRANVAHLTSDNEGALAWIAWATRDPNARHPDDPPPVIVVENVAEAALLKAARDGSLIAVRAALAAGARPDVTANQQMKFDDISWGYDYATPLAFALRRNDLKMAQTLLDAGATLDTRRLAMTEAADNGTLETMEWVVAKGARATGWRYGRYHPVHELINRRRFYVGETRATFVERQTEQELDYEALGLAAADAATLRAVAQARLAQELTRFIDEDDTIAMLRTMLEAGADPNARMDNDSTLLMGADEKRVRVLLEFGADPMKRNIHGQTALHHLRDPAVVPLFVDHGADINTTATPHPDDDRSNRATPLQQAMILESFDPQATVNIDALLAGGADPFARDGDGRGTLSYAATPERFEGLVARGLDPLAVGENGATVLHDMADTIAAPSSGRIAVLDRLLAAGVAINAPDARSQTVLHLVASKEWATLAGIDALLERGADPNLVDNDGKRPVDLVGPRDYLEEIRARLSAL